nr:Gag-Pol polyprotein [Tanacetum cinerariifolium]
MFEDLKYVQSLAKEAADLKKDIDDLKYKIENNDLLLQECVAKDILCVTYMSMLDSDNYCDMACKLLSVFLVKLSSGIKSQAGSESRPPMLNKENYVPWSSRLLRYAKSRPNGKLIHNSIINGPYVRRMIPEPGDANREVTQMMKGSNIGIQDKKAKLFNEWERFTSNERESIESYYHRFLKLMNDLKRNKHFPEKIASNLKQYAGQNARNMTGYNDVIENQVIQNAVQNLRVQNIGNQNGLIGVQGNVNQNQIGNGFGLSKSFLSQASSEETTKFEVAKFVGDFKSLTNEANASLAKHKALELEIERLLKAILSQDIMIIMQKESVVDTSDLQTELERTKECFENCIIK